MAIWKRVRGVVLFILCCVVISIIAMIAFPDYTERIIPAFFLVVFCGLLIVGILAANRYAMNAESEERRAKASKQPIARPYKWFAVWALFISGALLALRGIVAALFAISHRSINANATTAIEDGVLGALSIYCGYRTKKFLQNCSLRSAELKGTDAPPNSTV